MTDLTNITTPFGLLNAETQEALLAHGGPYEVYAVSDGIGWQPGEDFANNILDAFPALTWRVKPQPPKPREWWIVGGCEAYSSLADAEDAQGKLHFQQPIIHIREVLSDD